MSSILDPVFVNSLRLDIESLPDWRNMLDALPVGVGLKGGVARKILKVISGLKHHHPHFAAEMKGDGDIDVLIAVERVTPTLRLKLREQFTGTHLGSMVTEAKDIEVTDSMTRYFLSRDVTMNEVLAFRVSKEEFRLYYTHQAEHDVGSGTIRPCVHCLHTGFAQVWQFDQSEQIVLAPKMLARCIIRWLKGHGLHYGIGAATWHYYQQRGLDAQDIFRIFRYFVEDDEKFSLCFQHLVALRLLPRTANSNELWGKALFEVNQTLAHHGTRLTFKEPSAAKIEAWMQQKEKEYRQWQFERQSKQAIGLKVEPDMTAPVILPDGLSNFPALYHSRGEWSGMRPQMDLHQASCNGATM